jgi:hypothetical protein
MGLAVVGLLMICAAVFLGCRLFRVRPTVPVLLVVGVLLAAGAVNASAVPGLSRLDDMKAELDNWSDDRIAEASGEEGTVTVAGASAHSSKPDCPESAQ